MATPTVALATRVTADVAEKFEKLAHERETNISGLLRELVSEYMAEQEAK